MLAQSKHNGMAVEDHRLDPDLRDSSLNIEHVKE